MNLHRHKKNRKFEWRWNIYIISYQEIFLVIKGYKDNFTCRTLQKPCRVNTATNRTNQKYAPFDRKDPMRKITASFARYSSRKHTLKSNHEEPSDELKQRDILLNNQQVNFKRIKGMKVKERSRNCFRLVIAKET